ncbi:hypothetical protein LC586_28520 [Nostoc sp. CHAB 5714]|uniref:Uncharacterized protein n=1 Tax=Nostoc favosum CHAB5714 TaxID=2780399 RepID=A0ABS8IFL0_9NOSO|nr:hypothetical protein [Nostoc favosum CHAB5714]
MGVERYTIYFLDDYSGSHSDAVQQGVVGARQCRAPTDVLEILNSQFM